MTRNGATLAIRGGTVVDASGSRRADVLIGADGSILDVATDLDGDRTLDASGCFVGPGLVDLHTHLREPGKEEARRTTPADQYDIRYRVEWAGEE